jgi:hypothetical protein
MDSNTYGLIVAALLNAIPSTIAAVMSWRASSTVKESQVNIQKIETATNSMKDALVRKTGEAAHAAGKEEGIAIGVDKAAARAEGRLAGEHAAKS